MASPAKLSPFQKHLDKTKAIKQLCVDGWICWSMFDWLSSVVSLSICCIQCTYMHMHAVLKAANAPFCRIYSEAYINLAIVHIQYWPIVEIIRCTFPNDKHWTAFVASCWFLFISFSVILSCFGKALRFHIKKKHGHGLRNVLHLSKNELSYISYNKQWFQKLTNGTVIFPDPISTKQNSWGFPLNSYWDAFDSISFGSCEKWQENGGPYVLCLWSNQKSHNILMFQPKTRVKTLTLLTFLLQGHTRSYNQKRNCILALMKPFAFQQTLPKSYWHFLTH